MKKFKQEVIQLSYVLILPLLNVAYFILNSSDRGIHSLVTDIDRAVPFIKPFIFPYILWYPFVYCCLLYFFIKDRRTYFKALISLISGILISYSIYFIYQTTVPRPLIYETDFVSRIIKFIYNSDLPYNCFPSLHVYESYIMIKAIKLSRIKNKVNTAIIFIFSSMIILSTQFIKQHVILDLISAILLGEIIYNFVNSFSFGGIVEWIRKRYSSLMMKKRLEN